RVSMPEPDLRALQTGFAGYLRDPAHAPPPAGVEQRRLDVYSGLVYRNVENFMANAFPVLRRLLPDARWHALVREFLVDHRATTPLFPKMPQEFLRFLEQRVDKDDDLPYMAELAHYEWLEAEVAFDTHEIADVVVDAQVDFERGGAVPNPVLRPHVYRWPVHRIGPDQQPTAPPPQPVYLVVFRHRDDRIGFMELNAVSGRLLQLVIENAGTQPAGTLLDVIATELAHPEPAVVVRGGREILQTFLARDISLGTRRV
ncbi:MAG: putative DNA-binding domain-containing protein, partial [Gammaproteobacteria bacterium]